ncbi:MAG: glycosyltransferase, partial [Synergistaceae bacterium]|nr:glycosyltransferase [Synergistaceae bacterium]
NVSNIEQKLRKSQLFVISSDHEGIPNALLEALAVGLPCVTTEFTGGGCGECINNNINGLIVPVGDVTALAEAMLKILRDEEFAARLSQNAKLTSLRRYYPDVIFEKWESCILSVTKRKVEDS